MKRLASEIDHRIDRHSIAVSSFTNQWVMMESGLNSDLVPFAGDQTNLEQ